MTTYDTDDDDIEFDFFDEPETQDGPGPRLTRETLEAAQRDEDARQ